MIINDAKDLEAAPSDVRELFVERLADGINRWSWENGEWMLGQNTAEIEQFGFTLNDFPDAPIPDKPDYNPDERQLDQQAKEVRNERNALLSHSDWTQVPDAPVDAAAWAYYRQELRDLPHQDGFPTEVLWPTPPA
jgi:hypothetical protein